MYPLPPCSRRPASTRQRWSTVSCARSRIPTQGALLCGGHGLMQLMPATARLVANRYAPEAPGQSLRSADHMSLGQPTSPAAGRRRHTWCAPPRPTMAGRANVTRWDTYAERVGGSVALIASIRSNRDARLRAARDGELLDIPDPACQPTPVNRPDRPTNGPRYSRRTAPAVDLPGYVTIYMVT